MAIFDDSENLHRAAAEGMGIVLGRVTLARPLVEAGHLVELFDERLKTEFAHYLVYPSRSRDHRGLARFRDWLLEEAAIYAASDAMTPRPAGTSRKTAAPPRKPAGKQRTRAVR